MDGVGARVDPRRVDHALLVRRELERSVSQGSVLLDVLVLRLLVVWLGRLDGELGARKGALRRCIDLADVESERVVRRTATMGRSLAVRVGVV